MEVVGIIGIARRGGGRSAQPIRRRTRALGLLATASALLLLSLVAPGAAHADPGDEPPALDAPAAPTITSPVSGEFLGSGSAVVTGTKAAGSEVQILAGSSRTSVCTVKSADTAFSCPVSRLPSGPSISLSAVQLLDGSPKAESTPVIVDILAEPTIAGSSPQLTSGLVQGGGYPGATITLGIGGGTTWSFPSGPDGTWAYVLPRGLGSGTFTVTATQSTSFSHGRQSGPSAPRQVILDVDPPAAPLFRSPAPGSTIGPTGTVYSGSGEDQATVEVFAVTASGSDVGLCSAVVAHGQWSCTGAELPAGAATVTAYQRDAAGNVGAGSPPLDVRVQAPATTSPTPAPSPSDRDEPVPAPVVPVIPPSATPAPSSPSPAAPSTEDDAEGSHGWLHATPFTSGVPSALVAADLSWLRALLLAAVAVLLLLIPARMLATTIGARRVPHTALALTGRNRVPTHDDHAPDLASPGSVATTIVVVMAAGGIVLFANPVHGQPEYLRVFLASMTAIALLNLVAARLPKLLAPRLAHDTARIALSPRFLLTVAAVALFSRVLDLQPALLFGVVCTVTAVSGTRSSRGILALLRVGVVFAFGLAAWLASTLLGVPTGVAATAVTEVANIAAMAGVGSAAILLVPLGRLDGRALLNWSRAAWSASAVVVLTVLFALLAPVVDLWQESGEALVGLLAVVGFGSLGFSLWLWRRVIQPGLTN